MPTQNYRHTAAEPNSTATIRKQAALALTYARVEQLTDDAITGTPVGGAPIAEILIDARNRAAVAVDAAIHHAAAAAVELAARSSASFEKYPGIATTARVACDLQALPRAEAAARLNALADAFDAWATSNDDLHATVAATAPLPSV